MQTATKTDKLLLYMVLKYLTLLCYLSLVLWCCRLGDRKDILPVELILLKSLQTAVNVSRWSTL